MRDEGWGIGGWGDCHLAGEVHLATEYLMHAMQQSPATCSAMCSATSLVRSSDTQ